MVRYPSNFGDNLRMMVGIGKEYRFTLNFDMPRSFASRKTELPRKMANSQSDCRTASCIQELRWSKEVTLGTRLGFSKFSLSNRTDASASHNPTISQT